jgi:anhydro-N-acetylmuramic acid kinase
MSPAISKTTHARLAVGLMSGTSMDGIDAALVRISGSPDDPKVRLLAFLTVPYPERVRNVLARVAGGDMTTAAEISQLDFMLGEAFAAAALSVMRRGHVPPRRLSVIGSHGQTIHHSARWLPLPSQEFLAEFAKVQPKLEAMRKKLQKRARNGVDLALFAKLREAMYKGKPIKDIWFPGVSNTFQIAEPAVIAERTRVPVVADFRAADMAAGGQGAPLVPMLDYLLLRDKKQGTVALNIGGIANVTVIPANAQPEDVFGFDTGPGNMLIDGLVRHFTKGRKSYDAGGRWAAQGKVLQPLLDRMLAFRFFQREPPKSAGREQFGRWFIEHYFLRGRRGRSEDLLRTAAELTAATVAGALERFVFPRAHVDRLVISGGGAHNRVLLAGLQAFLPGLSLDLSDRYGLPVDAKEAIAFAVLADRTMHGLPGNLPRVTGARRAVVLGALTRP